MIEGNRIRLWSIEKFDVGRNYNWGNDPEMIRLTGMSPYPKSTVDLDQWFQSLCGNPNLKMFAMKTLEGEYIGNIEIADIDWRCGRGEIGLIIGEAHHRGQGYGSEAVRLLSAFAFDEMRMHRLEARVLAHNARAQATFERCGYTREGVAREAFYSEGRWVDVVTFSLLASDPRAPLSIAADKHEEARP